MEDDGIETPRTPFWIQSTTNVRRVELYRRRASSLFFNSGVLIVILLLFAVLSMVFIIPSIISFTSHFLKPNFVKKSWDSINLVLVLFALAFGFLSRNINNDHTSGNGLDRSRSDLSTGVPVSSPVVSTPNQWYDFSEQPISGLRRHRSTSSYPDLRELAPPWNHRDEPPWRFSDDTHLNNHRVLNYDRYYFRREQDFVTKDVPFDTVVDLPKDPFHPPLQPQITVEKSQSPSPEPPLQPAPPPPPPPPPPELIRTYHSVAADAGEKGGGSEFKKVLLPERQTESTENQDSGPKRGIAIGKRRKKDRGRAKSSEPRKLVSTSNDLAPEPPSSLPISPGFQDSEQNSGQTERKRTGTNATKEFFTSFYQKKKKKRQRQKSVDNLDFLLNHSQPPVKFQLPPPSPPQPPPPPPSKFNNLFTSKKERRNKSSASTPPVPPPPPPSKAARAPKPTITRVSPFVTEKPRVPVGSFNSIYDSSSGGESPVSRIPPPPPMPPFKMPDWKFAVEGDYVRVQSTLSSGSVSPEGDEAQSPAAAGATPVFCPSPDVNTKADRFIERFRAGLKLEKINSFNQNHGNRMSNLGPGPGPSRSYRL